MSARGRKLRSKGSGFSARVVDFDPQETSLSPEECCSPLTWIPL